MSPEKPSCTLSITSARCDWAYLDAIVRHLVRACNYPFVERILVMDTAPLGLRYLADPNLVSTEEFHAIGARLIRDGVIDRVDFPDYSPQARKLVYEKHLGGDHWETHDFRGTQVLGTMQQIANAQGDYFLHFDSDILLYQKPGFDWISSAIKLLHDVPEVIVALPRPGPPRADGELIQPFAEYTHDSRGFFSFKFISSRRFLIDRRKFNAVLPFKPLFVSWKKRLLSNITRRSTLLNWEQMATDKIRNTPYIRADLDSPDAWTLHAPDHGSKFCEMLPDIIRCVEEGKYPENQAGHYDLQLTGWDFRHEPEMAAKK
jgi:hypothetical protein